MDKVKAGAAEKQLKSERPPKAKFIFREEHAPVPPAVLGENFNPDDLDDDDDPDFGTFEITDDELDD